MAPKISFLTTAYRTEAYLPATIESVLAQRRTDWELVVVDNGASEAIRDIVSSYSDPRIRLLRQRNRGYEAGITSAAAAADGAFFCVLDSDDLLGPDYLQVMGGYLDAHPDVDALGCDAHEFLDGEGAPFGGGYLRSVGMRRRPRAGMPLEPADILAGLVPYYSGAIRRRAWHSVGGYEPGVPDVDESVLIWLRLADRFDVRLLPNRLAWYRIRPGSLSRDRDRVEEFERKQINTFEAHSRHCGPDGAPDTADAAVRRLRFHQELRRARWALLNDDVQAARVHARCAFSQRRGIRAAAVMATLAVAPGAARALHPAKQSVTGTARRASQRFVVRKQVPDRSARLAR